MAGVMDDQCSPCLLYTSMYRQAIARKHKLTSFLRENNYEKLSKRPNVTIYTGKGYLVSANTVKVALPAEEIELQGKEIFINTGSTPVSYTHLDVYKRQDGKTGIQSPVFCYGKPPVAYLSFPQCAYR